MTGALSEDLPEFLWVSDRPQRVPAGGVSRAGDQPPGEWGLWVFVLGDMTLFALFFITFLVEDRSHRRLFAASAHDLLLPVGAVNTLVLLVSSMLVVLALRAIERGASGPARRLVAGALGCAGVFIGLKAFEYTHELRAHHSPGSSLFFTFYFALTAIHLVHVLVGSGLLGWMRRRCADPDAYAASRVVVESCAVYWHMVDLLWLVIFTLLYVVCVA